MTIVKQIILHLKIKQLNYFIKVAFKYALYRKKIKLVCYQVLRTKFERIIEGNMLLHN